MGFLWAHTSTIGCIVLSVVTRSFSLPLVAHALMALTLALPTIRNS